MNDNITIHLEIDGKELARAVMKGLANMPDLLRKLRERERERAILEDMAYRRLDEHHSESEPT